MNIDFKEPKPPTFSKAPRRPNKQKRRSANKVRQAKENEEEEN